MKQHIDLLVVVVELAAVEEMDQLPILVLQVEVALLLQ
jgi:hypothetical protein